VRLDDAALQVQVKQAQAAVSLPKRIGARSSPVRGARTLL
jgi:hypothetical protein